MQGTSLNQAVNLVFKDAAHAEDLVPADVQGRSCLDCKPRKTFSSRAKIEGMWWLLKTPGLVWSALRNTDFLGVSNETVLDDEMAYIRKHRFRFMAPRPGQPRESSEWVFLGSPEPAYQKDSKAAAVAGDQ